MATRATFPTTTFKKKNIDSARSLESRAIAPIEKRPSPRPRSTPKTTYAVFSRAYLRSYTYARMPHGTQREKLLTRHAPLPDFLRILSFLSAIGARRDILDNCNDEKFRLFSKRDYISDSDMYSLSRNFFLR